MNQQKSPKRSLKADNSLTQNQDLNSDCNRHKSQPGYKAMYKTKGMKEAQQNARKFANSEDEALKFNSFIGNQPKNSCICRLIQATSNNLVFTIDRRQLTAKKQKPIAQTFDHSIASTLDFCLLLKTSAFQPTVLTACLCEA